MTRNEIEAQLNGLPMHAIVAFAARCARRAQPLTRTLSEIGQQTIERAIAVAEVVARGELKDSEEATAASTAASAIAKASAAKVAANAAGASAANAANAASAGAATTAATYASYAYDAAAYAFERTIAGSVATYDHDFAAQHDLKKLESLGLGKLGTLGKPVDPSESGPLGPLWPRGAPEWFAKATKVIPTRKQIETAQPFDEPGRLILSAYVDELANTDEVATALANLLYALNAAHIAEGGNGLVIDDMQIFVPEPEFAGVDEP